MGERAKQVGPAERGLFGRPDDDEGRLRRAPALPASCEPGRERAPWQGALLGALERPRGGTVRAPREQLPRASGERSCEKS